MKHIRIPDMGQGAQRVPVNGNDMPEPGWHRWQQIMPALRQARDTLDLNRGRLDLLEKLLACLPVDRLATLDGSELIVHVSNARLAEMMNRASDKTVTRLITEVEGRGLVRRKSSPNGKRYARKGPNGLHVAYGIDVGPLLRAMPDILRLAEEAQEQAELCRQARERCSLLAARLPAGNPLHDEVRRLLRRKLTVEQLEDIERRLCVETCETGGCAPQNACHKDSCHNPSDDRSVENDSAQPLRITPEIVDRTLPKVARLGRRLNASFRDLIDRIVLSLGITPTTWKKVIERAGFQEAALLAMVVYERQDRVRNPAGYLWSIISREAPETRPGSRLLSQIALGQGTWPVPRGGSTN